MDCPLECSSCGGTGEITEKLQREVREKYTVRFEDWSPASAASNTLLVLNVGLFLLTWPVVAPEPLRQAVLGWTLNHPHSFAHRELWRFLTPMFLHAGPLHLLMNCYFLVRFCPPLEGLYGRWRFLGLYLFAGLCGNILSWVVHAGAGIGASGALFGIGAAYIGLHRRWGFFGAAEIGAWSTYLLLFLVGGFFLTWLVPLDNWAHLGGAAGGLAYVMLGGRPRGK